jgi:hypothetical protein
MKTETITIDSPFGIQIEQRFYVQEPRADKLLIILPGRGYTIHHPVLSYLWQMGLANGWDVLPVEYGFQRTGMFEMHQMPHVMDDVKLTTEPVLQDHTYRHICIAGKSMGTPLAMQLAQTVHAEHISQILLTPIGPALQPAGDIPTLAIIGMEDSFYAPGVGDNPPPNVTWHILERLDHGLIDPDDWRYSLTMLETITAACEEFLRTGV